MLWFYLDDEREVPRGRKAILILDYDSMIHVINMCVEANVEFAIDFDHDLGDPYWSGYKVAQYIVEHEIPMAAFSVHSMNPVGAQNIRQLLTHYGYKEIR